MAREAIWITKLTGIGNATTWTVQMVNRQGTIQRIVGSLGGQHSSTGLGQVASWNWSMNVGTAAADPTPGPEDPPSVMLRGSALIPVTLNGAVGTPPNPVEFDSEGQRVIGPGESLWLSIGNALPPTGWGWVMQVRVLLLLPEA